MSKNRFERIPIVLAVMLAVLVVAACAIRLRGDQDQTPSGASITQGSSEATASKLERCRTVQYEQKDDLSACRKLWDEKRREFFGFGSGPSGARINESNPDATSPLRGKDESRLPSGYPSIPNNDE
ncbi:putative entry exclusion protein TrbK-alt [Bradyrhizobium sp. CCGUVB14]|uniref:putative entry exclusion protein TrbK-alt n=1 Tax=Bradyrhizobium sp. CCGUVB14 TaxID=2949628 RepID=UPI0020B2BB88|nr:putative entry exclusion protein TrbK-alt [Bradyrhizobium sp. CCGUVB14]MCP3441064.1 putative entry exclusion protein TrbK-alt [Bradyrhizobium sp. CCGUVB14]